jgi:hypothetical protein
MKTIRVNNIIIMRSDYHFVILTATRNRSVACSDGRFVFPKESEESHIWILRSFTNAQDDITLAFGMTLHFDSAYSLCHTLIIYNGPFS